MDYVHPRLGTRREALRQELKLLISHMIEVSPYANVNDPTLPGEGASISNFEADALVEG